MNIKKVLTLQDGKKTLINIQEGGGLSLCDVSLFMVSLLENLLLDQNNEFLSDQHGFPLGDTLGLLPQACAAEYDNGLIDQFGLYLFGTEGELLT
jgi:hypothetical protein